MSENLVRPLITPVVAWVTLGVLILIFVAMFLYILWFAAPRKP